MPPAVTEDLIRGVYRETIDSLYGYISRRCGGDRELAEDVTQETWLRAIAEWRTHGMPTSPLAWLTTVGRNLLLNELRKRRPIPLDAVPDEILRAVEDGSASDSAATAAVVTQALARLPEKQSRLLEAFHFERCRISQLAESMGVSERAIEGRLRRARESLRKELEAAAQTLGGVR